jgi:hypothetical protein
MQSQFVNYVSTAKQVAQKLEGWRVHQPAATAPAPAGAVHGSESGWGIASGSSAAQDFRSVRRHGRIQLVQVRPFNCEQ